VQIAETGKLTLSIKREIAGSMNLPWYGLRPASTAPSIALTRSRSSFQRDLAGPMIFHLPLPVAAKSRSDQ
jgi:hypothetical protein